jgi:hypothetical protein
MKALECDEVVLDPPAQPAIVIDRFASIAEHACGDASMNIGVICKAAFGLAAFLALSVPASATTFSYDLAGDTTTAYTDPAWPGWSYVDTADATTGTTSFPGYSVHVGDTIQVTLSLNNPATFNDLDLFLQEASNTATIFYDQTVLFSLGGVTVPNPGTGFWNGTAGARGGLGFSPGFSPDLGALTFDKLILNAVITALNDPMGSAVSSVDLLSAPTYVGFYNPSVATTPLPGGLLLMLTALGGLGIVGRRKRNLAAAG